MTLMSSQEMKVLRDNQLSKTDLDYLHQAKLTNMEPEDDEDSPDASILMRQEIEKRNIKDKIVLLKLSGTLEKGKVRIDQRYVNTFLK